MSADCTVDVFEQEGSLVVEVGLSGVRFEDVSVMLRGSHLVISACRPQEPEMRRYHLRGRRMPRVFSHEVMLPAHARPGLATATYLQGLLRIHVPLGSEPAQAGRPIPVKDLTAALAGGTTGQRRSRLEGDGNESPAGTGAVEGGTAPAPGSGFPSQPQSVSVRRCALCNVSMDEEVGASEPPSPAARILYGLCSACRPGGSGV